MKSLIPLACVCSALALAQGEQQPYAGEETRSIKSLSSAEVERLEAGEGMGLALAAELNHYPGPRHVLELAEELGLSEEQRKLTQEIHDDMRATAIHLGKSLVQAEARLDRAFASESIDVDTLTAMLEEIGQIRVQIRYTHLAAHIFQRKLLETQQVDKYDRLRGYGSDAVDHSRHH